MVRKAMTHPGNRRNGQVKPPTDQPERFRAEELHRGRREDHTQTKFVPVAKGLSLISGNEAKAPAPEPRGKRGGRMPRRSPSTFRLNKTNVKRKSSSR